MGDTSPEDVAKLTQHEQLVFWCAGCASKHVVPVGDQRMNWEWNGDKIRPSLDPSILIYGVEGHQPRCHFFMRAGTMEYLIDCQHRLRGQIVRMIALIEV